MAHNMPNMCREEGRDFQGQDCAGLPRRARKSLPWKERTTRMNDRVCFLMLFCALLLVKNSQATLEQSLLVLPLEGKAGRLARSLCR